MSASFVKGSSQLKVMAPGVDAEFVVATPDVLDEGMSSDHADAVRSHRRPRIGLNRAFSRP